MGFGHCGNRRHRNEALLAKWLWRYSMETDSLWHKVIASKYGSHPLNWVSGRSLKGTFRNPWKEIAAGLRFFSQYVKFSAGNGTNALFWEDVWLAIDLFVSQFPRLYHSVSLKFSLVASVLPPQGSSSSFSFGFSRPLSDRESLEVILLISLLDDYRGCYS